MIILHAGLIGTELLLWGEQPSVGQLPILQGEEWFLEPVEPIYAAASSLGMDVFLGGRRAGQNKSLTPPKPKPQKKSRFTELL